MPSRLDCPHTCSWPALALCTDLSIEYLPPTIISQPLTLHAFGGQYLFDVVTIDADSDAFNFHLMEAPAGLLISADGIVTWPASDVALGNVEVSIRIIDELGGRDFQQFQLDVVPAGTGSFKSFGAKLKSVRRQAQRIASDAIQRTAMEHLATPGLEGTERCTQLDIAGAIIDYFAAQVDFPKIDLR